MRGLQLPPEQEAEAQVLCQRLKGAFAREALQVARVMASKEDRQLLGRTEFAVRDPVHRLGAQGWERVFQEGKKKGIRGRVPPVRSARSPRAALATAAKRS